MRRQLPRGAPIGDIHPGHRHRADRLHEGHPGSGSEALDRFFERYPEFRERLTFVQVGVPSRGHIASYQQVEKEVDRLVEQLNWRWGTLKWRPVVYFKRHFSPVEMAALHRLANFCIVSSLHDGMNLVAKEFVASRPDEDGVLVLSQFAGAALELSDAVLFNPYAIDELADAIRQAVEMPQAEQEEADAADAICRAGQQRLSLGGLRSVSPSEIRHARRAQLDPIRIEVPEHATAPTDFRAGVECFAPATK